MLAQNPDGGGDASGINNYYLIGVQKVPRVNSNTTTETVVQISVKSKQYLVTFTWFMTLKTYKSDGYTAAASLKTAEVDQICGHEHVQGFRSEQDQDNSNLLINNAVIDVGTEDGNSIETIRYRMDQIDQPGVFAAVDKAWDKLVKLGAS